MVCLAPRGDGSLRTLPNATSLLVCRQLKLGFLEEPQVSKCQQLVPIHGAVFGPLEEWTVERQERERGRPAAFPPAASDRANEATTDVREEETLELEQQNSAEGPFSKRPPGSGKPLQDAVQMRKGNPPGAECRTLVAIWEICSKQHNLITVDLKRQTSSRR